MEKFPNIDKVGGSVSLSKVEEQLEDNRREAREDFNDSEIIPTEEEAQIIDAVSYGLRVMLEHIYKIPCKQILKEKIHIVKEGTLSNKYGRGMHQSPSGDIYLEPLISCGSKIVFAKVLAHELVHYLSFHSVKTIEKEGKVKVSPHIGGLGILKFEEAGVREYFNAVDEAATSYISNKFLNLELNRVKNHQEGKMVYTDECLAVDIVREWLHSLPDFVDVERNEWDKYYIVSIPFAEEMVKMIRSSVSDEEKVAFYKARIANLPKKEKADFYLERTREIEDVYKEISAMFAIEEPDSSVVKQKTMDFIEKVALLKLTGKGFLDVVRFIEKRLGRGSFKKLAEKFSKFKEYEKSSNKFPFDINDLKDSDISKQHKKGKFFESEKLPNKVIRIENIEELLNKHSGKIEIPELVEIAKRLYKELEEKYGILVPAEFFLGKGKLGNSVVYSVADKIEGQHLGEIEKSKEVIEKVEALYTSVARYFLDKSKEGGLYLWDICGESQYIYGKKVGDEEEKIYLIDTDIWLNNSRVGMYLVVYWLTRHMSGAEMDFNTKFTEARDYIKQFISQSLPDNMSEDDMKNVEGIRSFLNNEKSDYNPESAIPNFE